MFRGYSELRPTPDGVFTWGEGETMPLSRGRKKEEPAEAKAPARLPKLPIGSRWESQTLDPSTLAGHVRVHYKDAGEHDVTGEKDWPLARKLNRVDSEKYYEEPEYESDPDKIYEKTPAGTRHKRSDRYAANYFTDADEAENATWRAYQHDVDWMETVDQAFGRGEVVDDDRYITDNNDWTAIANDELTEEEAEDDYVNVNRVWHRLDE